MLGTKDQELGTKYRSKGSVLGSFSGVHVLEGAGVRIPSYNHIQNVYPFGQVKNDVRPNPNTIPVRVPVHL